MRRGIYTDFETGKRYLLIDRGALGVVACELSDDIQPDELAAESEEQ